MAQLITPYLYIRKKTKPTGYAHLACVNKDCERHGKSAGTNDKFCGNCGGRISWYESEKPQRHIIEELENYDEQFYAVATEEKDHDIYVWNYGEFTHNLRAKAYSGKELLENYLICRDQVLTEIRERYPALFKEMDENGFIYKLEYGIVGHYG